jgi:hypothetical protein
MPKPRISPSYHTDDIDRLFRSLCCYTKYTRAYITPDNPNRCSPRVDGPYFELFNHHQNAQLSETKSLGIL